MTPVSLLAACRASSDAPAARSSQQPVERREIEPRHRRERQDRSTALRLQSDAACSTQGCSPADDEQPVDSGALAAVRAIGVSARLAASVPPDVKITLARRRPAARRRCRAPLRSARGPRGPRRGPRTGCRAAPAPPTIAVARLRPQRRGRVVIEVDRAASSASVDAVCPTASAAKSLQFAACLACRRRRRNRYAAALLADGIRRTSFGIILTAF